MKINAANNGINLPAAALSSSCPVADSFLTPSASTTPLTISNRCRDIYRYYGQLKHSKNVQYHEKQQTIYLPESIMADTIFGIWPRAPTFPQKTLPLIRHVGSVEQSEF